ncbi:YraN family protein [Nostocoides sp. F2B08]|uniref:YraN family protein n=1 Tax=Nostocoides sp. F2B08 TaxID=2653936 RepID=UPI001263CE82|nr:YraN family protein [Tetrasphaera sp. F2B08]KAB7746043.1 YraN family protein [Tetrasphaera sp. F2B08]
MKSSGQDSSGHGTGLVDDRRSLGDVGEALAARYLTERGARVLARNWRCLEGELDLVVVEPDGVVVAVEVKTRRGVGFGDPVEAVTSVKQQRLRRLLAQWLRQNPAVAASGLRIDVVGVLIRRGQPIQVRHITGVGA